MGRLIPDDLAVLGFGNLEFAEWMNPALSTFQQPTYEIGRKCSA
ncbi:MAG TPA: substrate-binding domain-containing protein [Ignavibacteria bacterium]|nr:substrate-binding domain-containing protein [Ignavibacteria bacterium]